MLRSFGSVAAVVLLMAACGDGGQANVTAQEMSWNLEITFPAVGGEAIVLTPAVSGTVDRYSVSPSLPSGLSIDELSGVISGTATKASSAATYVVSATGAGVRVTFPLVLSVTEPPSGLSYVNPVSATVGVALAPLSPSITGIVDHYAVSPTLPPGMVLSSTSGILSGTPSEARHLAPYTITATSRAGSSHFVLLLSVTTRGRAQCSGAAPCREGHTGR